MLHHSVKLSMTFPPSNSFSGTHSVLALNHAHIDGNLDGVVHTVNVSIVNDSGSPIWLFTWSIRALSMVSKLPLPLYSSRTPASQICKLWQDPFLSGSGCDLG